MEKDLLEPMKFEKPNKLVEKEIKELLLNTNHN